MTFQETMSALESMGTEQTRKTYRRHGVGDNQFGVSFANMDKLSKRIKTDHTLALALWATGNHDARILATRVADPAALTERELNAWVKDIDCYVLADAFGGAVYAGRHAKSRMEAWMKSRDEFPSTVGWNLAARFASEGDLPDDFFAACVKAVEAGVSKAKNRTRYAMNTAMINIGLRNAKTEKLVAAAAKRIGPIEVDHGETGCKTPDIIPYIEKTKAYRAAKNKKK